MVGQKHLLLGTRKGLFQFVAQDHDWRMVRHSFEGIPALYACYDARNDTIWVSLDHGHWGQKLHRSTDGGQTWQEIPAPKYPETAMLKDDKPAALELIWYIQPGGADQPQRLYLGTNPGGLFVSDDGGDTFQFADSLWNHPSRPENWFGGGKDNAGICSILVHPDDPRHLTLTVSVGGVYVSRDGGATWEGRNKGIVSEFLPNPESEYGHDPHYITHCPARPEVLWQQNHCGIYRSENGGESWEEISQSDGPARFGWAICAHETDPLTAWVVPAHSDMSRVTIDQSLCVSRTEDGGKTWTAFREGLPQELCYDIVYRHAFHNMGDSLMFGSTTGNLFFSTDAGASWRTLANYLPPVYSVRMYAN
ncbi:Glycosyl hydrolase [Sulfidibacter corallicola]|uniref:Glycosyl hydrolase n=1 Tax=Sulfidibacter corallicola TaxID=2818388 RepID=A0A8A4U0K4_SULCO|nr:hypothetical protein [Sulfidibacter corallicola]QTD52275.1 hypothetical protein J3U87_07355 [Sulfidibacter corallicola]